MCRYGRSEVAASGTVPLVSGALIGVPVYIERARITAEGGRRAQRQGDDLDDFYLPEHPPRNTLNPRPRVLGDGTWHSVLGWFMA